MLYPYIYIYIWSNLGIKYWYEYGYKKLDQSGMKKCDTLVILTLGAIYLKGFCYDRKLTWVRMLHQYCGSHEKL